MKFSTRQDTAHGAAALFAAVCDLSRIERAMLRRGAELRRLDPGRPLGEGSSWEVGFDWRGHPRALTLEVATLAPPERLVFSGRLEQFDVTIAMTVVALSPRKSRLICEVDVSPRGMKARLMLQTARLGKAQLDRRFAERVQDLVEGLAISRHG
jgi:hypothetical protein